LKAFRIWLKSCSFPKPRSSRGLKRAVSLLFPFSPSEEKNYAAAGYIIGNFTKPVAGRPSLLTQSEAICLLHEFGHGLHHLLGRSPYFVFSGLQVKGDFVELPSSLLENWLWDPAILKLVSSHYLTGEPLPDETIDRLANDSFGLGYRRLRMCFLSELSLALHSTPELKNPTQLVHRMYQEKIPHTVCNEKNHFHDSWWHFPEYASRYYSYLWSESLSADLFQKIKKQGLLNPEAGAAYSDAILRKGGSRDPNLLLLDYLGREPNFDACFSSFELDE